MSVHELFAYICVKNTGEAIEFYRRAFGATEKFRLTEPGGRIGHAEIDLGGATLMLCDEFPEYGIVAPQAVLAMQREGLNLSAQDVFANPAFALTPAAASRNFIAMDGAYLLGFGPRTASAVKDLAASLYGDALKK